jgi:hypothetical protein
MPAVLEPNRPNPARVIFESAIRASKYKVPKWYQLASKRAKEKGKKRSQKQLPPIVQLFEAF